MCLHSLIWLYSCSAVFIRIGGRKEDINGKEGGHKWEGLCLYNSTEKCLGGIVVYT